MKLRLLILAACVCSGVVRTWAADSTITFTTPESPRMSASGYVDWAQVSMKTGSRLINVFGYNSGPQQWVQLYDSTNGIVVAIADSVQGANSWNTGAAMLSLGQALQFTNTIGTLAAGIYFVRPATNPAVGSFTFQLYDTRAHAMNAAATTGIKTVSADALTGNTHLIPKHVFAVASTDNYSFIVPGTGMNFGRGIVIAASTTGPTFTPPSTNITICATYLQ